ncbi:MAG: gliding motility-associated C-terminal domain-containing protein [Saprospiraceae bacterium]|nr:gliding motility-associated C-terminal domain-containing protein [Saprospiraceae bacterium]
MKQFLFSLLFTFTAVVAAFAQPSNDDCSGAINLGLAPFCNNNQIYTNELATTSNIGLENNPTCFNGGLPSRDVWFTFIASDTIENYAITVTGVGDNAMLMPQIALYRGDGCGIDELAETFCAQAPLNASEITLIATGLNEPGAVYYLRVNDYSASAASNEGTFTLCVSEYVPDIIMGEVESTTACFGTLHDSGGPTGDYSNNENLTFTICPTDFHSCIQLDMINYDIEQFDQFGGDFINVFAGPDINAPLLARVSGNGVEGEFSIQASSACVTIQFRSDGSVQGDGFMMTWNCSAQPCDGSSPSNPTPITTLPFEQGGFTTCGDAVNLGPTECTNDDFLLGPDYVFTYTSPGNECISVGVTNANTGTGIAVFLGDPTDPANSTCIRSVPGNFISFVRLEDAGTYYIVIANPNGCTDFGVNIQYSNCALDPSLTGSLCNPLNGCAALDESGNLLPSVFYFEQGFEDMTLTSGVNSGCWLGAGFQPDFYWFTIEAQTNGPFGFLFDSADEPTDIDFNVWGPFRRSQVCDSSDWVINYIATNQPIRSSWTGGVGTTGCVATHPITGIPVTDAYDCGDPTTPGAGGDRYISVIDAQEGDVYVVLANDFGEGIAENGMLIDWYPSAPGVLFPPGITIVDGDTSICVGQGVSLLIDSGFDNISWSPATTLSCGGCPNPVAFPSETTNYQVIVTGTCVSDTAQITVGVFTLDLGNNVSVCRNEDFQLNVNGIYPNAQYSFHWTDPVGFLSCTDCANPVFNSNTSGSYTFHCTLTTPSCVLTDSITVNVLTAIAPTFSVGNDVEICKGSSTNFNATAANNVTFEWTSVPAGFTSSEINPTVSPTETTTYYVTAINNNCPLPSLDSIKVTVFTAPIVNIVSDTLLCQGDAIVMGNTTVDNNIDYTWSPNVGVDDVTNPNSTLYAVSSNFYVLTAVNGACVTKDTVSVSVIPIAIAINNQPDTTSICLGTQVPISTTITPSIATVTWSPSAGLNTSTGASVIATPSETTTYYATVTVAQCIRTDSILINVDSLPWNKMAIVPSDTTVCQGALILLKSSAYEPEDFPNIDIQWRPSSGFVYSDTLWNAVLNAPDQTTVYNRIITNGLCRDTSSATVNVIPVAILQILPQDPEICPGETITLNLTSNQPMQEIEWMPTNGLSCTDCSTVMASPISTTNYQVRVTTNGCPSLVGVTVNVLPFPTYQFPSDRVLCPGESVQLNGVTSPNVSYSWSSSNGSLNSSEAQPTVSPTATTVYYLTASNADCTIQDSVTIVVANATLELIDNVTICLGDNIDIMAQGSLPGTYVWSPSGFVGQTINVSPTQTTNFNVDYTYGDNCHLTDVVTVNIATPFTVNIIANPDSSTVQQGQVVALSAITTPNQPGATYAWSENGVPMQVTGASINVNLVSVPTATYTVTVTSADGCIRTATIVFNVLPVDYKIPNTFTPDGDNVNDYFNIIASTNILIKEFKVFNRWGEIVYDNDNPTNGWNGKSGGKDQPSDGYVYMIKLIFPTGEEKLLKGGINLIR